jgi:hypothetical protein
MYGLVNRAVEQLVVSLKGEPGWRGVCAHAGVSSDGFVATEIYDDKLTFDLVNAVSVRMGLPVETVLEAFGEYWITYTAAEGYESIMDSGGNNLREFLGNLNSMHGRVEATFAHLSIPQFRVEDISPHEYHLFYRSTRDGLAPMVIGLVKGLGKRFDQAIEVRHIHAKAIVSEEDIFLVRHVCD